MVCDIVRFTPGDLSGVPVGGYGGTPAAGSLRIPRIIQGEVVPLLGSSFDRGNPASAGAKDPPSIITYPAHEYRNKDTCRGQQTLPPAVCCDLPQTLNQEAVA